MYILHVIRYISFRNTRPLFLFMSANLTNSNCFPIILLLSAVNESPQCRRKSTNVESHYIFRSIKTGSLIHKLMVAEANRYSISNWSATIQCITAHKYGIAFCSSIYLFSVQLLSVQSLNRFSWGCRWLIYLILTSN